MTHLTRWLTPKLILGMVGSLAVLGVAVAVPAYRAAGQAKAARAMAEAAAREGTRTAARAAMIREFYDAFNRAVADAARQEETRQAAASAAAVTIDAAAAAADERVAHEAAVRAAAGRAASAAAAVAAAGRETGQALGDLAGRATDRVQGLRAGWLIEAGTAARTHRAAEEARRARAAVAAATGVGRDLDRLAGRFVGLAETASEAATRVAEATAAAAGRAAEARTALLAAEAEAERVVATAAAEAEFERLIAAMVEAAQPAAPTTWPEAIKAVWQDASLSQLKGPKAELSRLGFKYTPDALAQDVKYDPATKALTWTVDADQGITAEALRPSLLVVVTEAGERLPEFTNTDVRTAILNGFRVVVRSAPPTPEVAPGGPFVPCPTACDPCDPCATVNLCRQPRTRCCGANKPVLRCR